jgi:hypothetical protein
MEYRFVVAPEGWMRENLLSSKSMVDYRLLFI